MCTATATIEIRTGLPSKLPKLWANCPNTFHDAYEAQTGAQGRMLSVKKRTARLRRAAPEYSRTTNRSLA